MFDLKSWLAGYALGRAGISAATAPKPLRYRYNGHLLPQLPIWDGEAYPHAFLLIPDQSLPDSDYTVLYVLSDGPVCENGMVLFGEASVLRGEISGDGHWSALTEAEGASVVAADVLWTNRDICDADGTVCLAAAQPVPVYEQG